MWVMSNYPTLLSSFTIGRTTIKNRVAMNPMGTRLCPDGTVNDAERAWSEERARGGLGLMISGGALVHPTSNSRGNLMGLVEGWHDEGLEGQRARVEAVHRHGCKIFGQFLHLGRDVGTGAVGGLIETPTLAPSPLRSGTTEWGPKQMDADDIAMVVKAFGKTARLFHEAGMDGLELHGAHNYLIGQFLSRYSNHRSDEYGAQSDDTRMRFLFEVIDEVRSQVGDEIALGVRLSAVEGVPNGLEVEDTQRFAERLEALGSVDYLHLTMGVRGAYVKDNTFEQGFARDAVAEVRRATGLPLIQAGRITSPEVAESILADGVADLVGIGRQLIADPEWVNKAEQGDRPIRPCLAIAQDCRLSQAGATCAVSATAGRETVWSVHDVLRGPDHASLVVVGGGPAGLEAARLAAEAGLDVVLFEAEDELGGQLRRAARAPYRENWLDYRDYLETSVRSAGATIRLGTAATPEAVAALSPSAVLVATGSLPGELPAYAVHAALPVATTWDVFAELPPELPDSVVVVDDGTGFWEVCGAADLLAARGVRVELVTPNPMVGRSIPHESVMPLHRRLAAAGATYHVMSTVTEIGADAVVIASLVDGSERKVAAGAVVVQVPNLAVNQLADHLEAAGGATVVTVGDAIAPRRLGYATLEAHRAVRDLISGSTSDQRTAERIPVS
jgi:2,4-dienoyl-CoA reductase-like NADH-dependent reductase (Old Yellow Enzyme family)